MLTISLKDIYQFIPPEDLESGVPEALGALDTLLSGSGAGSDYTGWLSLPESFDKAEFARIRQAAVRIQKSSQALVVIGIGGSYLGARAAIEYLRSPFYNQLKKDTPDIYFAGNNLSAGYIQEIISLLGDRDFSVNVISKSGTTTEPAVAFRIFKTMLESKYGRAGARSRIFATTDKSRGALHDLAAAEGYERFVIPDDIGGRYSVLTPVGLLPMAVAGIDIGSVMAGAAGAMPAFTRRDVDNPSLRYALARSLLYRSGKTTEILACYEPSFRYMAEWWKQLFGESEGKDRRGIFPASVDLTADLHSMGQYIQQGLRNLFETVVDIRELRVKMEIKPEKDDADGLNFLAGMDLGVVNRQARRGTVLAHVDGGVPNILVSTDRADEANLGELICFFEVACGISGYLLKVNPFDQPGVESYKRNMFALLGKPGYEELKKQLSAKMKDNDE